MSYEERKEFYEKMKSKIDPSVKRKREEAKEQAAIQKFFGSASYKYSMIMGIVAAFVFTLIIADLVMEPNTNVYHIERMIRSRLSTKDYHGLMRVSENNYTYWVDNYIFYSARFQDEVLVTESKIFQEVIKIELNNESGHFELERSNMLSAWPFMGLVLLLPLISITYKGASRLYGLTMIYNMFAIPLILMFIFMWGGRLFRMLGMNIPF